MSERYWYQDGSPVVSAAVAIVCVAPTVLIPIIVIAWKYGITGQSRSLIQGLIIVFAAMLASGTYLALKIELSREPDFFEKFWISIPLLASFVVSGRCIFGRLGRLIVQSRQRRRPPQKGDV